MSVRSVEALDGVEIAEWRIFLDEHPLPDHWLIGGLICQHIHNSAMGCKKAKSLWDVLEVFPWFKKRKR